MAGFETEEEEEQPLDPAAERVRRKLVRFMVINLAILFAAVMAVVLAFVYRTVSTQPHDAVAEDVVEPTAESLSGEIVIPEGARIISHAVSGNRLTLHLRLPGANDVVLLYDMAEGRQLGRFNLREASQ